MKYLGLAYYNPEKFAAMVPGEVQALVSQCPPTDEKMRATGKMLVSASLSEPKDWMTLRPRGGKPQITDGPYTEAKEVVGVCSSSRLQAVTRPCASRPCTPPPRWVKRADGASS